MLVEKSAEETRRIAEMNWNRLLEAAEEADMVAVPDEMLEGISGGAYSLVVAAARIPGGTKYRMSAV